MRAEGEGLALFCRLRGRHQYDDPRGAVVDSRSLAAVTVPSFSKAGRSLAMASMVAP